MTGWIAAGVLYVLGAVLCMTVPAVARREQGGIKLAVCLLWPVPVVIGLIGVPGALLLRKELRR